jgi:hypothetical protein
MRPALAVLGVVTVAAALLTACGGGAESEEVGARKAACNNAPDYSFRSPSQAPAPAPTDGKAAASASLAAFRAGALPPESVGELMPKAKYVVEARVARVLYQGETPEGDTEENVAGAIPPARCQVVQLDVTRRVSGADPGGSVTVVKPLAPYVLKADQDTTGVAFLVRGADPLPIILGRYGPYSVPEVEAALAAATGQ